MAAGIGLGISMGWTYAKKGFSAIIQGLFAILEARSTYFENANNSKLSVQELETAGLLDKASIILTPTGYSEDVIHNVKPSATLFGDMTHILASTSATRVNEDGLVTTVVTRDVPRIDYSKGKGAILTELASVNQIRYSEDFSNALWTKAAITITSSTKTNPKGVNQTIYNITRAPASGDGLYASFASAPTGQGTGVSIWIKRTSGAGSTGNVWIGYGNSTSGNGNSVAVGNEWQRISYASPGVGGGMIYIDPQYGHYFDVWGAQGEKSSANGREGMVSSYIPTVSTSVTRPRDNYLNGGDASLIGAQEGVFYIEAAVLADSGISKAVALSASNSPANRVVIFYSSISNTIQGRVQASSSTTIPINGAVSSTKDFNKIAFKYKSGDLALWINGTEVATSTTAFTFNAALSELAFDQGNGSIHMDGFIKQLAVFKEALTDTELAALTS
tara:strand:- start:1756 stop:3096 length:1341 start_codon:yes stop_codon:yes gene_type:complete